MAKGKLVLGVGAGLLLGYLFKRETGMLEPCPQTTNNDYIPDVLISEPIKGQLHKIGSFHRTPLSGRRKAW